jgi:hypothetical protein
MDNYAKLERIVTSNIFTNDDKSLIMRLLSTNNNRETAKIASRIIWKSAIDQQEFIQIMRDITTHGIDMDKLNVIKRNILPEVQSNRRPFMTRNRNGVGDGNGTVDKQVERTRGPFMSGGRNANKNNYPDAIIVYEPGKSANFTPFNSQRVKPTIQPPIRTRSIPVDKKEIIIPHDISPLRPNPSSLDHGTIPTYVPQPINTSLVSDAQGNHNRSPFVRQEPIIEHRPLSADEKDVNMLEKGETTNLDNGNCIQRPLHVALRIYRKFFMGLMGTMSNIAYISNLSRYGDIIVRDIPAMIHIDKGICQLYLGAPSNRVHSNTYKLTGSPSHDIVDIVGDDLSIHIANENRKYGLYSSLVHGLLSVYQRECMSSIKNYILIPRVVHLATDSHGNIHPLTIKMHHKLSDCLTAFILRDQATMELIIGKVCCGLNMLQQTCWFVHGNLTIDNIYVRYDNLSTGLVDGNFELFLVRFDNTYMNFIESDQPNIEIKPPTQIKTIHTIRSFIGDFDVIIFLKSLYDHYGRIIHGTSIIDHILQKINIHPGELTRDIDDYRKQVSLFPENKNILFGNNYLPSDIAIKLKIICGNDFELFHKVNWHVSGTGHNVHAPEFTPHSPAAIGLSDTSPGLNLGAQEFTPHSPAAIGLSDTSPGLNLGAQEFTPSGGIHAIPGTPEHNITIDHMVPTFQRYIADVDVNEIKNIGTTVEFLGQKMIMECIHNMPDDISIFETYGDLRFAIALKNEDRGPDDKPMDFPTFTANGYFTMLNGDHVRTKYIWNKRPNQRQITHIPNALGNINANKLQINDFDHNVSMIHQITADHNSVYGMVSGLILSTYRQIKTSDKFIPIPYVHYVTVGRKFDNDDHDGLYYTFSGDAEKPLLVAMIENSLSEELFASVLYNVINGIKTLHDDINFVDCNLGLSSISIKWDNRRIIPYITDFSYAKYDIGDAKFRSPEYTKVNDYYVRSGDQFKFDLKFDVLRLLFDILVCLLKDGRGKLSNVYKFMPSVGIKTRDFSRSHAYLFLHKLLNEPDIKNMVKIIKDLINEYISLYGDIPDRIPNDWGKNILEIISITSSQGRTNGGDLLSIHPENAGDPDPFDVDLLLNTIRKYIQDPQLIL